MVIRLAGYGLLFLAVGAIGWMAYGPLGLIVAVACVLLLANLES